MTITIAWHWWMLPALITIATFNAARLAPCHPGEFSGIEVLLWYFLAGVATVVSWSAYGIFVLLGWI